VKAEERKRKIEEKKVKAEERLKKREEKKITDEERKKQSEKRKANKRDMRRGEGHENSQKEDESELMEGAGLGALIHKRSLEGKDVKKVEEKKVVKKEDVTMFNN
jgi:translation initiation factor 5B